MIHIQRLTANIVIVDTAGHNLTPGNAGMSSAWPYSYSKHAMHGHGH